MSTQQPNIVLIMADQLAAPALPFYGHPVVQTPHLSEMARNGILFENAYCNSPLCAPSRASMLTGQLPSRIGAYDNAAYFHGDLPTLAHYLRAMGYSTCLSGKMHHVGPDQLHGFEERLTTDIYPSDFGWTPDWENFSERPSWYHNLLSVVQAGMCETSNQLDYDEEVAYRSIRKIYDLARQPDQHPFFMCVSFTHPHDPYTISPEYWDRYDHDQIDLPAVPPIPYEKMDAHSQRLYHVCGLGEYELTGERIRQARHAYYGMISYIDDKVGQLLQTLKRTNLFENTVVVFLSDHGDMLGERGLFYKMNFFEWSARVPLLFYAPGRFHSRRIGYPVSLVDLLPTLVEMGSPGLTPVYADPLDGDSLLPLFSGLPQGEGVEFADRPVFGEMLCEGAVAPLLMVRHGEFKYIYSPSDPEQLYNLANDPNELNNLTSTPENQAKRAAYWQQVTTRWDVTRLHQQVIASQHRRRSVYRALRVGRFHPWDFQPEQDATTQYMRNHLDLNVLEKTSRFPSPQSPEPDGENQSEWLNL